MLLTWPCIAARITSGASAELAATRNGTPRRPFGEQLGGAAAAAIIDPQPRPVDEQVAAAEAGELGVADDRAARRDRG